MHAYQKQQVIEIGKVYIYCLCLSCYTDTTRTTFCESGFNPHHTIIFGVLAALLIIFCIISVVITFIVILKKDNDLLNYQKNMLSTKELAIENINSELQKAMESSGLTEPPPPIG